MLGHSGRQRAAGEIGIHPQTLHIILKILQLGIDIAVTPLLGHIYILQFAENDMKRILQRKDAHFFLGRIGSIIPPHTEIRINQHQRFQRQIFQLQIPCRMVHRNMGDGGHIFFLKPLPGIIIMQMGHPLHFAGLAAKLADIMPHCRTADQSQIDRHAGFLQLTGHMHGHIMHTGNMAQRVEEKDFLADVHQLIDIIFAKIVQKPFIFLFNHMIRQRVQR